MSGQRIGQLIESDGPGGAESVLLALCESLRTRGHVVAPAVFADGEGWLSGRLRGADLGVTTFRISRRIWLDPHLVLRMARWAVQRGLTLLHSHEFTMSVYAAAVSRLTGIPHVLTMHGGTHFADAGRRRVALRWAARRASAVVGVSEPTCAHLARTLGLSSDRVTLVPNGVPVREGNRPLARAQLGAAPSERLLLAVGNLYPVKGHRVLIDAVARLQQAEGLPPWRLLLAGRGSEESALRSAIEQAGLGDRVVLLGLRADIPDLLAAADVWVMPSLSEGLPMALLEAMFASLPCVCSAVGGIPALLALADAGRLVPPGDAAALAHALDQVLRDPSGARALGQRAHAVVAAHYSVDAMTARYLDVYAAATAASVRTWRTGRVQPRSAVSR